MWAALVFSMRGRLEACTTITSPLPPFKGGIGVCLRQEEMG